MTKKKVNSSALGYAISFLLLVGLVCSSILFIASVNKRLERNYSIQEHLVFNNLLVMKLATNKAEIGKFQFEHITGDTSILTLKNWGSFRIAIVKTFHGSRSIIKTTLIGSSSLYSYGTVYLPDQRQKIKVCGNTKIEGNIYTSEIGLERGHIAGNAYKNDKLFYGELKKSEKQLPELNSDCKNLTLESFLSDYIKIDFPLKDSTFSFEKTTSLVTQTEPINIQNKLGGNLIVHSFDSIYVGAQSSLENVILIAPKVTFEKGFIGSVQVIAHELVTLQEDVHLRYPSSIVLNEISENRDRSERGVVLMERSSIVGGILLVSQKPDFRNPVKLELKKAVVGGLIYNVGETQIIGKVHGYVYTNAFTLRAGGGEYKNHLLNAEIKSTDLPKELILPQWIQTDIPKIGEIIAWI